MLITKEDIMQKLFVVVRRDLAPGAMLAQACHGLRAFAAAHPELDAAWYRESNNLVCLEVEDEAALERLRARAEAAGVAYATFREPDFDDAVTSIAIAPDGWRLVSSLPLAMKERRAA